MPENQKKLNQELNKTNKTQEEINKKIKDGASLSKSMQDTLKKQADTLGKSEKYLKGMNSESKKISQQAQKSSKQSKKEAETGQRIYKSRWKLNKAFKEQVGFASKSAGVERLGLSYQKAYQDELAKAREIYQDNQTAAVTTVGVINKMRDATRGVTDAQLSRVIATNAQASLDAELIENAGMINERISRSGKVTKTFSKGYETLVNLSMGARDLAIDTAKAYDDIGTEGFRMIDTSEKRAEIEEEIASIGNRYFGANKKIGEELKEKLKTQLMSLDATDKQNKLQDMMNRKVQGAQKFITGPFEKLHGLLESMPMGSLIAPMIGVDRHMEDFLENTRSGLTAAMDPNNLKTFDEAITEIGTSGMTAINGIVGGFKSLGKAILANPMFAFVAAMVAAGTALSAIYDGILETRKELGVSFSNAAKLQSTINLTAMQFKLLGVTGEDVKAITDGIRNDLGGTTQP